MNKDRRNSSVEVPLGLDSEFLYGRHSALWVKDFPNVLA